MKAAVEETEKCLKRERVEAAASMPVPTEDTLTDLYVTVGQYNRLFRCRLAP